MKVWGITGGIGSGKSKVLEEFKIRGYPVLDTDMVARQVVDPNTSMGHQSLEKIASLVGSPILAQDGQLDRGALRKWLTQSDDHRQALERILHPLIRAATTEWMELQRRHALMPAAFIEASRMIETGMTKLLDGVLWVTAPRALRLERAAKRDGRSSNEIEALARLQLDDERFAEHASETIVNAGSLEELRDKVSVFLKKTALFQDPSSQGSS